LLILLPITQRFDRTDLWSREFEGSRNQKDIVMSQQNPALNATAGGTRSPNAPQSPSTQPGPTRQTTGNAADTAKQKGARLHEQVNQVSAQASEATAAVKGKAAEATEQAKDSARKYAAEKKSRVADEIGVFSGAIRKASGKLREEQHDSIACYVDAAAEQLDRIRDSLQNKSTSQIMDDVQGFARRRPELVYGGMFLAGLTAMRFLKASKPKRRVSDRRDRSSERYREDSSSDKQSSSKPSGGLR
jgi:hypothetical protein